LKPTADETPQKRTQRAFKPGKVAEDATAGAAPVTAVPKKPADEMGKTMFENIDKLEWNEIMMKVVSEIWDENTAASWAKFESSTEDEWKTACEMIA
jgi:hypothetical protein